ncbi:MAG: hypothetical protein R2715_19850 [Ilumatobacteraceae bacterium]
MDRGATAGHAGQGVRAGHVQHGQGAARLETTYKPGVTLGDYQESKIRWIHQLLDEWIGDDE